MEDLNRRMKRAAIRLLKMTDIVPFYELGDAVAEIKGYAAPLDLWESMARGLAAACKDDDFDYRSFKALKAWVYRWAGLLGLDTGWVIGHIYDLKENV